MASAILAVTFALVTAPRAQNSFDGDTVTEVAKAYHSPQNFAVEFKIGPYTPSLDAEFGGSATPYADLFGDSSGLIYEGEFDWQIWRGFGSIGLGISLAYFGQSAAPFGDDSVGGKPASGETRVAGETSITLLPIALLAVYRFDVLANRWHIPLVPYVKAGLTYTFWWIRKGNGDVASDGGSDASGGNFGWQVNLGLALRLDILEPNAAKSLDVNAGVNHSYIFFEMKHLAADGFGSAKALDVGATTWLAGLAFEF